MTGRNNARLRLEHSYKQKEYMYWKYIQLKNVFQREPFKIERIHPKTQQLYQYLRLQSHSSPILGKLRRVLYDDFGKRKVSEELEKLLKSRITLAVWYMDDGYYYQRDKSIHIYLPSYSVKEITCLVDIFAKNFSLTPKWYCRKDKKSCHLNFTGEEKDKFVKKVRPYILPYFYYKLPPLTP